MTMHRPLGPARGAPPSPSRLTLPLALLCLLAPGSVARAQAPDPDPIRAVDAVLARMAASEGEAYLKARRSLAELDAAARDELGRRLGAATFSEASWRDDALVAIALAWLDDPESFARVYAVRGVQARHYLRRRRPAPSAARELRHLGPAGAPACLEVWLKTLEVYPFSAPRELPAGLSAGEVARLRAAERLALREGLLVALGASAHPAAPQLLAAVLGDAEVELALRRDAAVALGQTGAAWTLPTLGGFAREASEPLALREAALIGLGRLRSREALTELTPYARGGAGALLQRTSIAALGALGSSWAWSASGDAAAGEALRRDAAALLVELLLDSKGEGCEPAIVEALAVIAWPGAAALLEERGRDDALPEAARRRAEHALARLELALSRER